MCASPGIAFVTDENVPDLTADDALVIPYLEEFHIQVSPAVWDDPAVDWNPFDAIIIRSCWDYHLKVAAFHRWINEVKGAGYNVWNPAETLSWNARKNYLQDLAGQGIRIPDTVWLKAGGTPDLRDVMRTTGWNRVVLKPVVAATAYRTWTVDFETAPKYQARLNEILQSGEAMIQEYLPEIAEDGEWSFVFFDKQYSHAVKKRARAGDFRVQEKFGGTAVSGAPPPELIDQAEAVIRSVSTPLLYARVDGVNRNGEFFLMELELIEPSLFLGNDPLAPQKFARAIRRILDEGKPA